MSNKEQKAICILGMHRSGTSAITRAVNLLGPFIGGQERMLRPIEGDNPRGFWEHTGIYLFHERLLSFLSLSWDSISPPPEDWWIRPEIIPYREELTRLIQENFGDQCLWMWKDPRTSLLLPLWKEVMQELDIDVSYLICVRNPLDVAASLLRRNGFSKSKSLSLWLLYNLSALHWTDSSKRILVYYDDLIDDWESTLAKVSTFFQIPWPTDAEGFRNKITGFLNSDERHNFSDPEAVFRDQDIPLPAKKLFRLLLEMLGKEKIAPSRSLSEDIDRLFGDYVEYAKIFPSTDFMTHRMTGELPGIKTTSVLSAEYRSDLVIESLVFPSFEAPRVSIIIPVRNHWEYTRQCLQALLANTDGVAYEVIIVDNGSSDRTVELLSKTKNVTIMRNEINEGYGRANNQGALQAKGEYLMFLNNDTEPCREWLKELLNVAAAPGIGAVGAKLIYADGRLQEAGAMVFSDGQSLSFGNGDNPDEEIYNVMCEVDFCSGACLLVKKQLFTALGGFDERYAPAYYEDADLAFGIRKIGYKVVFNPNAVVVHHQSITARSSRVMNYYLINKLKFVEKWKDELSGQDISYLVSGHPPATACRERLVHANLRPEDILDGMDDKREAHAQQPISLVSDISLLYRTLDEKISKSTEVIEKAAAFYGREDVGIEWTGGEDSVVVLHMVRQAFGGIIPFCVVDMTSSMESSGKDDLLEKLREAWVFELRKTGENMGFRAVITARRRDGKLQPDELLYFIREKTPRSIRVQPMLHFREVDVWQYIKRYCLPFGEAYIAESPACSAFLGESAHPGSIKPLQEFKATISVEEAPSVLTVGAGASLRVKIRNESSDLWPAQKNSTGACGINLAYHWIDRSGKIIEFDGVRTPLTASVRPAADIVLDALIIAPLLPGEYFLEFDMVQERVAWFKDRGSATASVAIIVEDRH